MLPNDEDRLHSPYDMLADHGNLLVVVDQPATIGAVAVAQDMSIIVGYLPRLSMRRIADLTPGSAKTDAKDAAVISSAVLCAPNQPRNYPQPLDTPTNPTTRRPKHHVHTDDPKRCPVLSRTGHLWNGSGDRIRTCDLRVMSPASYRTAPPRVGETNLRGHPALEANSEGVPLLTAR